MSASLRPITLGEILDRTVNIYRAKFLLFVGISFVPVVATAVVWLAGFVFSELFASAPNFPLVLKVLRGQIELWMPTLWPLEYAGYLAWPATAYLASRVLFAEEPTLLSAIWWCAARWRSWLGLAAIYWVAFQWLPFAARKWVLDHYWLQYQVRSALGFGGVWPSPRFMIPLVISVGLAFAAWFNIALDESAPAWTLENSDLRAALRRGWEFGISGWGKVLVAWMLVRVLSLILTQSLRFFVFLILRFFPGFLNHVQWAYPALYGILGIAGGVAQLLIVPLLPIAATLIYYDQRVRREGYDIELLMSAAGLNAAPAGEAAKAGNIPTEPAQP